MTMKNDPVHPLWHTLLANAAISLLSASPMTFAPNVVGGWLGVTAPFVPQIISIGLGLFAVDLIYQTTRPRVSTVRALLASGGDSG